MPVHNNGLTCDMGAIAAIARRHGLKVIVDSCQSIGTPYRGDRHATVGDIGAFSFVRNKSMTCGGEGGMVVTDDDELAYRAQLLSNHGRGPALPGVPRRGADRLQLPAERGALGDRPRPAPPRRRLEPRASDQHRPLPGAAGRARSAGDDHRGARRGASTPACGCVALVPRRDELVDHLRKRDIGVSPEYKLPIHLNAPYVQRFGFRPGQCPVSEQVAQETLILPNWPGLTRGGRRVRGRRDRGASSAVDDG